MPEEQPEITLGLLSAVQEDSALTQRRVAQDLGVALGLVNSYLKRCIKKGYIKVTQAPANRYAYYLTPTGFAEKGRLTAEYLSSSFTFFRNSRNQCSEILEHCAGHNLNRIALAGAGDLAEIVTLCANEFPVTLAGLIDETYAEPSFRDLPVVARANDLEGLDAVIISDLLAPQATFDQVAEEYPPDRIFAPLILGISRTKPTLQE